MSEDRLIRIENKLDHHFKRTGELETQLASLKMRVTYLGIGIAIIGTFLFDAIKKKLGM